MPRCNHLRDYSRLNRWLREGGEEVPMLRGAMRRLGLAVVRGRSMQPTLRDGDRLLVRHGAVPSLGDLAVVRLPDGVLAVKRVTRREPGGWWVERDNPREGVDSWSVGAIPEADLVAVVLFRVWPLLRRQ